MDDKLMFTMWELIVVLMIVIILTISVRGLANDSTYWKKYHSTDLALMTDLMTSTNGDFVVNYEIKDLNSNLITDVLKIDPLRLVIYLKGGAYYVYDESIEKDRFPQSYIFANDKDITIINSNVTSDYVVVHKEGNKISLKTDYVSTTVNCPSLNTAGKLEEIYFDVIPISDSAKAYSSYMSNVINPRGTNRGSKDSEFILNINDNKNVVYYDDLSTGKTKSEKMACLIRRKILTDNPEIKIDMKPYSSLSLEEKNSQKSIIDLASTYNYWIYININSKEFTDQKLSKLMYDAIVEYYQ